MIKILLVGCGHMGSALLVSWYKKKSFNFSVIDPNNYKKIKQKYSKKISTYKSMNEISNINKFDIIVFAIKPQIAKQVVEKFNSITKKIFYLSV